MDQAMIASWWQISLDIARDSVTSGCRYCTPEFRQLLNNELAKLEKLTVPQTQQELAECAALVPAFTTKVHTVVHASTQLKYARAAETPKMVLAHARRFCEETPLDSDTFQRVMQFNMEVNTMIHSTGDG